MKKLIVFIILLVAINHLYSQDFPSVEAMLKEKYGEKDTSKWRESNPESWRDAEDIVLSCVNIILTTPDVDNIPNRNEMCQFVLEWTGKGKYDLPIQDELGMKMRKIGTNVWLYYMYSMVKCYLQNNNEDLNITELQFESVETLLEYITNEKNIPEDSEFKSVINNVEFQELIKAKSEGNLKELLNL